MRVLHQEDTAQDMGIETKEQQPVTVQLKPPTLLRLQALVQQRAALEARFNETVAVALEAMGVTGTVKGVDTGTGTVTMQDVPAQQPQQQQE